MLRIGGLNSDQPRFQALSPPLPSPLPKKQQQQQQKTKKQKKRKERKESYKRKDESLENCLV